MINIEENYAKFLKYATHYISRDGIEPLMNWLDSTDIRYAPETTQYNLSCDGGLVRHSINVFLNLIKLLKSRFGDNIPYPIESIAIVSLFADIGKTNCYEKYMKNTKNANGVWESSEAYRVREYENRMLYGSLEENSLYIIQQFMKLTHEECLAIRYHLGSGAEVSDQFYTSRMHRVYQTCPLAFYLHMAYEEAMYVDDYTCLIEKEEKKEVSEDAKQDTAEAVGDGEEKVQS